MGVIFWLPVIISLAIVVGGLILNAFIAGKQFERKADKGEVELALTKKVDKEIFNEFKKEIYDEWDDYDDRFEEMNQKLDQISDLREILGRIDERTKQIQKNCDKEICK